MEHTFHMKINSIQRFLLTIQRHTPELFHSEIENKKQVTAEEVYMRLNY